jgi:hypothetical protein
MSKRSKIEVPNKDMVRRIRQAYLGIPDDSPFDRHLLIWSFGNALRAAFVPEIPNALSFRGRRYQVEQRYIGDWDPILNSARRLVGLSILLWKVEPLLRSEFLHRHEDLNCDGGLLQILLHRDSEAETECIQGVGTRLYSDSQSDYMFLFPQWCDWGEVAFPVATADIPHLE